MLCVKANARGREASHAEHDPVNGGRSSMGQRHISGDTHRGDHYAFQHILQQALRVFHRRLLRELTVERANSGLARGDGEVEHHHIRPGNEFRRQFHVHA